MDLGEVVWGSMEWIGLARNRDKRKILANAVIGILGSIKCWEVLEKLNNWWPIEQCLGQ
jgi:hypothetical protein